MKKIICLLLIMLMATSLFAGCSGSSDFPENDLTIINTKTDAKISIGMSRGAIEDRIGKPISKKGFGNNYEGLTIHYYQNKAVAFILHASDGGNSPWMTKRGISINSSIEATALAYGASFRESGSTKVLNLYLNEKLKLHSEDKIAEEIHKRSSNGPMSAEDRQELNNLRKYTLNFNMMESEQLSITIGRSENLWTFKYDK